MPSKPTSTHRTSDVIDKLQQAAGDDDKTIETFAQVDTTRPLQARNGEHGHVTDGPRGLETFHAHDDPPGDIAHGHKRGRGLDWTAAVTDYVPPFSAATAPNVAAPEGDPPPAVSDRTGTGDATPDAARASEPALTGGSGGTAGAGRPTAGETAFEADERRVAALKAEGRPTAIVPFADPAALQDLGSRMEATERKIRGRLSEFKTVASLALLVDAALKQLDYDDLVGPEVVRQMKQTVDRWAEDRGVSGS